MENYKITIVQTRCVWGVDISQTIANKLDGKYYQRVTIENDCNRQIHCNS